MYTLRPLHIILILLGSSTWIARLPDHQRATSGGMFMFLLILYVAVQGRTSNTSNTTRIEPHPATGAPLRSIIGTAYEGGYDQLVTVNANGQLNKIPLASILPTSGTIRISLRKEIPDGWLLCDGRTLDSVVTSSGGKYIEEDLAILKERIGNTLPDFQGRSPIGRGRDTHVLGAAFGSFMPSIRPHRHETGINSYTVLYNTDDPSKIEKKTEINGIDPKWTHARRHGVAIHVLDHDSAAVPIRTNEWHRPSSSGHKPVFPIYGAQSYTNVWDERNPDNGDLYKRVDKITNRNMFNVKTNVITGYLEWVPAVHKSGTVNPTWIPPALTVHYIIKI